MAKIGGGGYASGSGYAGGDSVRDYATNDVGKEDYAPSSSA